MKSNDNGWTFRLQAEQGALVTSATVQALNLPYLQQVHYSARFLFIISMDLSTLAIFFTCLSQRTYSSVQDSSAMRTWLSNGIVYTDAEGHHVMQSSHAVHHLFQAPFEFLCMSIAVFLGAIGIYLGSAFQNAIPLSSSQVRGGNRGLLIAFVILTTLCLSLFGLLLGGKDVEQERCMRHMKVGQNFAVERSIEGVEAQKEPANTIKTTNSLRETPLPSELRSMDILAEALKEAAAAYRKCATAETTVLQGVQNHAILETR